MSRMEQIKIIIHDLNGRPSPAILKACACGCDRWLVYSLVVAGGLHDHYQCAGCDTTYCDGGCGPAEPVGFTCPRCGMVSHDPEDNRRRYCGHCHDFM